MPTDNDGRAEIATAAALLRERLGSFVPVDRLVAQAVPDILDRLRRDLAPLSGRTLGELLLDASPNVGTLVTVKDYCKKLAAEDRSEPARTVAIAIYYAAIASALVFHSQKITTHSYENLEKSFKLLIEKPWMTADLADLFTRAKTICERRR